MARPVKKAAAKKRTAKKTVKKVVAKTVRPRTRLAAPKKSSYPEFVAKTGIEITAMFDDQMGLTAKVAAAVAGENVNILAATGYSASGLRQKAIFTLVVDDYAKAELALERIGAHEIHESTVILVETPNKVGALERIAKMLSNAGINIYYFYASTSSGATATSVIKTADDKKAIKVLRQA